MSIAWAPVVAALGAAALTGLASLGIAAFAQRRADRRESARQKRDGYLALLNATNLLLALGQSNRALLQARTGFGEGIGVLLRVRRPVNTEALLLQFRTGMTKLLDAQDALSTVGSQKAIQLGERIALGASEYLAACGEMTPHQRRWLELLAWKPTDAQARHLDGKLRELARMRAAFVGVVREELGHTPVRLSIDGHAEESSDSARSDSGA